MHCGLTLELHQHGLRLRVRPLASTITPAPCATVDLDPTDHRILDHMAQMHMYDVIVWTTRIPGVSQSTAWRRLHKMELEGIVYRDRKLGWRLHTYSRAA